MHSMLRKSAQEGRVIRIRMIGGCDIFNNGVINVCKEGIKPHYSPGFCPRKTSVDFNAIPFIHSFIPGGSSVQVSTISTFILQSKLAKWQSNCCKTRVRFQ